MARRFLPCALCVGVLGCGSDVIEHADRPSDSTTIAASATDGFDSFGDVTGSTASPEGGNGNFPEPALTRCGELGEDIYPIGNLGSAWGVVAVGGTVDEDGEVEPGTIRLRLGDGGLFDCQESLEVSSWGFALTLAPDEAVLGVHELAGLFAPALELVRDGQPTSLSITGTLALARVTQDCVVGVLSHVAIDGTLAPELDGGFAAELCARTCLPTATRDC